MPTITLPLGTEVEYRGMTGRDEDILTNKKKVMSGDAINEVLANCVLRLNEKETVQPGDVERLKDPERTALLIAVRAESYGDEVPVELQCSAAGCGEKFDVEVRLEELEQVPAPADYQPGQPFVAKLSDGTHVTFDYLDGRREKALAKVKDLSLTSGMLSQIVEVEGVHKNDLKKWLENLPVRVRSELRERMESTQCGPRTACTADCPSCGAEVRFDIRGQAGFFFHRTK